jgi:hypothetical protein
MAALFLLLLAVTGGVLIAELVVENPTADQITLFHHTLTGYSEGWLLAIAAGLGALITLLLVASLNATKARRVRRGQHRRRRRGLQHQVAAPEPDHTRLLEEFFGPEQPPPAPGWARQAGRPQGEGREGRAEADQSPVTVTPQWTGRHLEPLYEQVRSAHLSSAGSEGQAEDHRRVVMPTPEPIEHHPKPLYEQARRAAGLDNNWELPLPASQARRQ